MFHSFSSDKLPALRDSAKLPVSRLDAGTLAEPKPSFWQQHRFGLSVLLLLLVFIFAGAWYAMNTIRPSNKTIDLAMLNQELMTASVPKPTPQSKTPPVNKEPSQQVANKQADQPPGEHSAASPPKLQSMSAPIWRPDPNELFHDPQDHPPIDPTKAIRVLVVTVRAKVTAYTPYDHAQSHPQWADGVVAWHPRNRKRRVANHPYCLATDWSQFPGGSTFIRVPGYMSKTFPNFPESFRVVDDKCGRARRDNRHGGQPVVDVRYRTRHSAISGRDAWGLKHLDVEVIFPANFKVPASLQPWIVGAEWRTYKGGKIIKKETVY